MEKIKIAVGSDHGGYELKEIIKLYIEKLGYEYKDFGTYDGTSIDYPIIAKEVAKKVVDKEFDRGIIICGSGLGVAIAANKVKGIRAVTCHDTYCAKMSRLHNNANVLTMGGRVIGSDAACEIVKIWLETEFEGGRHQKRIDMLEE
jgi:ribose 5-phosphate isomerase B